MPQTPLSADTPYCSLYDTLQCYTKPILGDLCRPSPNYPPPSYLSLLDVRTVAGKRLYKHLLIGAGEIESRCTIAKRYSPLDLQALTGASQMLLIKLNVARGVWSLAQFLKPMTARMDDVPMAKESYELLHMLAMGEAIFGLIESMDAGLPSVVPPRPDRLETGNVIGYANRLFPNFGPRGIVNRPGRRGDGTG